MRWAIVIGVDEYGPGLTQLFGAVRDAVRFRDWVLSPSGGGVPRDQLRLLLGRRDADPNRSPEDLAPTKAALVAAINEVVAGAERQGGAEQLFFYFSGHGLTADLAGREESALALPGFDVDHPEHSLAVRSLAEHLETTPFADQFLLLDACRNPLREEHGQIGRWPIPRKRDPGKQPVQQFILYSTSPGLTSLEVGGVFDEATGAFSEVLMQALDGTGRAKAWSWERNCYEVRWEGLANFVNAVMKERKHPTKPPPAAEVPAGGWPIQIPQDAGSRGVAGRERDAILTSYGRSRFPAVGLEVVLEADTPFAEAEVSVLDSLGEPVVSRLKVAGSPVTFKLPPRTYAAQATTLDERAGRVTAPIEHYDDGTRAVVRLGPQDTRQNGQPGAESPPGRIEIVAHDPLATAEVRDEAGNAARDVTGRPAGALRDGDELVAKPGFYRVRHVRPERPDAEGGTAAGEEAFVVLAAGAREQVPLAAPEPDRVAVALAEALGGGASENHVLAYGGAEPAAWAHPSTVLSTAIGAALDGDAALERIGLEPPRAAMDGNGAGVAFYVVAADGKPESIAGFSVRAWPAGEGIPSPVRRRRLAPSEHAVAGTVLPVAAPVPHWLAIEREGSAIVLALPVLPGRLATVVAQVEPTWTRIYQFHPPLERGGSRASARMRRLEHLERLLLGGALDGAGPLAHELAKEARADPFAGLVAGYVLLRLGAHDALDDLVAQVVEVAPTLADAYILRGEREAAARRTDAAYQAFADAVNAGIPMFGEGLTRLVEGLRASAFHHPRGALVRHIFRRHVRGTMWSAFAPSRPLSPGQLVISGADVGYEG